MVSLREVEQTSLKIHGNLPLLPCIFHHQDGRITLSKPLMDPVIAFYEISVAFSDFVQRALVHQVGFSVHHTLP